MAALAELRSASDIRDGYQDREYSTRQSARITNLMWERVVSRDSHLPSGGGTHQSLALYNRHGIVTDNPITQELTDQMKRDIAVTVREAVNRLTPREVSMMSKLIPNLVSALILDRRFLGKVYDEDFPSTFKIAVNLFMEPDAIDRSHFIVAMGGTEVVGNRVPGYIVPALESIKKIHEVFIVQSNSAIDNELHDRLEMRFPKEGKTEEEWDEEMAPRIEALDTFIAKKIKTVVGENERVVDGNQAPYSTRDYLDEIQTPKKISPHDMRRVLEEVWAEWEGKPLDSASLAKRYHFTEKLPRLVVVNGAQAAININRMDREKVLEARDRMQKMTHDYVYTFHRGYEKALVFQNDAEWDTHDNTTKLLLQYKNDLIMQSDGTTKTALAQLQEMGIHHEKDTAIRIRDMSPSLAYARLHDDFFSDRPRQRKGLDEVFPTNIMEPLRDPENGEYLPQPFHRLVRQGPPEIVFKVIRAITTEESSLSGFMNWLENRHRILNDNYHRIAAEITAKARELQASPKGAKRDFRSVLAQTIPQVIRPAIAQMADSSADDTESKERSKARIDPAMNFFGGIINAEGFPTKGSSAEQQQYWTERLKDLNTPLLTDTEFHTDESRRAELEEIEAALHHMRFHKEMVIAYQNRVDIALQDANRQLVEELARQGEAEFLRECTYHECVTTGFDMAAYYLVAGDVQAWPAVNGVVRTSRRSYEAALTPLQERYKRLNGEKEGRGTIGYITSEIKNRGATLPLDDVTLQWANSWVDSNDALSSKFSAWTADAQRKFIHLCTLIDELEINGGTLQSIDPIKVTHIDSIAEDLIDKVKTTTELPDDIVEGLIYRVILSNAAKNGGDELLRNTKAAIFQVHSAYGDYRMILKNINPTIADLETHQKRIADLLRMNKNGDKDDKERSKKEALKAELDDVTQKLDIELQIAEEAYNRFLAQSFGSPNGTDHHGTIFQSNRPLAVTYAH